MSLLDLKNTRFKKQILSKTKGFPPFYKLAICVICSSFLFVSAPFKALAQSEASPSVVFIYGLSKSMWAKLDNEIKVTITQKALSNALKTYDKKIEAGLLTYGHIENRGCNSVQVIKPLQKLSASSFVPMINPLRPRGAAPIGQALLDAASLVKDKSKPLRIILLSDGLGKCPLNPCETALSLNGANPNITIDVIGIGKPNSPNINPLSCVISPSNGKLTYARSTKEISVALGASIERAKLAKPQLIAQNKSEEKSDNSWAGATEIIVEPTKKTITGAVEKDGKTELKDKFEQNNLKVNNTHGGLALVAHLNDGGTEIKSGLVWRIYNEKPDKKTGKHKLISAHRTAAPVMSLSKGTYLINAAYGRSFLTRKVNIEPGKNKTEHFILNAGGLRISSVLANGTPISENKVTFDIYSDERDQFGKRLKVISKVRPGVVVRLNAGIYHIISTYGDANAQSRADISLVAGKLTEATINHLSAKVTFKLVYQKGGEALADTKWSLLSPRGDLIKKSAGALPTHILAAGDYTILAERGSQKYSQNFTVTAGDTKQVEVIIQ